MEKNYNEKRINPPIWQHDYHVLKRLHDSLKLIFDKYHPQKKGTLLDYGCGSFPYYDSLGKNVKRYIGVDISDNTKADILVKPGEPIPLADATVDIVLSTQVLEHVEDVSFYLSQCCRLLKRKGLLILSTHGVWPYHPFPTDYHRWTRKGLEKKVEKSGFQVLQVSSLLGPFATTCQFQLLLLAERLGRRKVWFKGLLAILSLLGNGIIWLEDKLSPPTEVSDAVLFVICAKKR